MKQNTKGLIFALIALFSWGIHGPAGRFLALNEVSMYFIFTARIWIGCFVFFIFLLLKRELNIKIKDNFKLVLSVSLVGLVINSLLYHLALIYIPATLLMILENISPVFVFLMSFFIYKIVPKPIEFLSLVLALGGIVFISLGKNSFSALGDKFYFGVFLGVLTGFTFGFYTFFSAVLMKPLKNQPVEIIRNLFKIFLISSILTTPFLFSAQKPDRFIEWFWLLEMGIFQSGLSYIFWNYALSLLPTNTASILFILTIIFTTINEILFLNLSLNIPLVVGGILICTSAYLLQKNGKNKKVITNE